MKSTHYNHYTRAWVSMDFAEPSEFDADEHGDVAVREWDKSSEHFVTNIYNWKVAPAHGSWWLPLRPPCPFPPVKEQKH